MIDVDDLVPFGEPLVSREAVRYRPIEGDQELALIRALPPHSFGDGHEVYDGRGAIIAMCATAEYAGLICRSINERYSEWFDRQTGLPPVSAIIYDLDRYVTDGEWVGAQVQVYWKADTDPLDAAGRVICQLVKDFNSKKRGYEIVVRKEWLSIHKPVSCC